MIRNLAIFALLYVLANTTFAEGKTVYDFSAYHKYQKCGIKAANRLFKTGW